MRTRTTRFPLTLVVVALMVAGCVTINLYFPEQEVQDLAKKIEAQVAEQAAAEGGPGKDATAPGEPPAKDDPKPEIGTGAAAGSPVGWLDTLLGVTPAYAQQVPEPEMTNPAIRKIIDLRAARLAEVQRYKASGVIGENNKGDLEIRDLGAVADLRARAEVQKLVRAENADREQLYKEIAAAKGIDPSQLDRIRETYAETIRANARTGEWIQSPDGSWKQKG